MTMGNLEKLLGSGAVLADLMGWVGRNFDASVGWTDVEWVRSQWDGPLIIKGVLDPEDAREAAANGIDALVVSNHGGRQLDGALSTARALPAIADAVGERVTSSRRRRRSIGPRRRAHARARRRLRPAGARLGLCARSRGGAGVANALN